MCEMHNCPNQAGFHEAEEFYALCDYHFEQVVRGTIYD
jgi:hypothetical protein